MWTRRWLAAGGVFSVSAALAVAVVFATNANAQTDKAKDKDTAKTTKDDKKPSKPRGRLPAYYRQVVDDGQRTKIYALQAKYRKDSAQITAEVRGLSKKLAEVRKKLAQLKAAESKEVEAVLTAEQKKKVDALRAEAAAKRKKKQDEKKDAKKDDKKPSSPRKKTS